MSRKGGERGERDNYPGDRSGQEQLQCCGLGCERCGGQTTPDAARDSGNFHAGFAGLRDRDAEAIAEAATRPTMRFVPMKTEGKFDMQTLHRARERLVGERTALINQLRAILLERGITVP